MKRTPKKRIDYTDWTVEQHIEHLKTEPAYLNYYKDFDPESVETFIVEYAKTKHSRFKDEPYYKPKYEYNQTRFMHLADDYIDQILQKKLFNLQCQWRACLIELPLIDICADFDYWEKNIRSCPFLPLITQEDIDLCIRFLHEELDNSNNDYEEKIWQDYDKFKNQLHIDEYGEKLGGYHSSADLPDLYLFFDTFQGTTGLLDLPNIRGKKEARFIDEGWRIVYEQEIADAKADGTYKEAQKPSLDEAGNVIPEVYIPNLYVHNADNFVEAVEDERTKEVFKYYEYSRTGLFSLTYDGLNDDLKLLKEFDEPIAVEAADDWREAIRVATFRFKQRKAAEMLPYAYDTYLLEFDEDEDAQSIVARRLATHQYNNEYKLYNYLLRTKSRFLDGREALTGKRDFNYLED